MLRKFGLVALAAILLSGWTFGVGSLSGWQPVKIGGGGFMTGLDIANDGTRVARYDSGGPFISTIANRTWANLVTTASMPASMTTGYPFQLGGNGVLEIAVAHSNSSIIYMIVGGHMLKSTDKGATFTDQSTGGSPAFTPLDQGTSTANYQGGLGHSRLAGHKMLVDPINPNRVIVTTPQAGTLMTTDGGATWTTLSAIPSSTSVAGGWMGGTVYFDPSSSTASGFTHGIYVHPWGSVPYKSTDGGATWAATTAGGPTTNKQMRVAIDGTLWIVSDDGDVTGGNENLWKYVGTTWTRFVQANVFAGNRTAYAIAIDPTNASHVVVANDGGTLTVSANGGTTWTEISSGGIAFGTRTCPAGTPNWMCTTNEVSFSTAALEFDQNNTNDLLIAEGIGIWETNPPSTAVAFNWTNITSGIEGFVSNVIMVSPAYTSPLMAVWDRSVFATTNPAIYAATQQPPSAINNSIGAAWAFDYTTSTPGTICALINWDGPFDISGCTTDNGTTWNAFAATPMSASSNRKGGTIAAASPTNIIVMPSSRAPYPIVTADGGASWNNITDTNMPHNQTATVTIDIPTSTITWTGHNLQAGWPIFFTDNAGDTLPTPLFKSSDGSGSYAYVSPTGLTANTFKVTMTPGGADATFSGTQSGSHTAQVVNGTGFVWSTRWRAVTADKVSPSTFYLYNTISGTYKSTSGGASGSWTHVSSVLLDGMGTGQDGAIKSVPGLAGHLFAGGGNITFGSGTLNHSMDGGSIWCAIANITKVDNFDFGKPKPGGTGYPTVIAFGQVSGAYGIYEADDFSTTVCDPTPTWRLIATYPNGNSLEGVNVIAGDPNTYGMFYVGNGSSGFVSYRP